MHRAEVRRALKRVQRRKSLGSDAPDLPEGIPADAEASWRIEDLVAERLCRQLRSVGDALAWRVTSFDRNYILALSRNAPSGPMAGKSGLPAELGTVEELFRERKHFALLHDLTTSLRIADLTEFTADGGRMLWEVKTNAASKRTAQTRRMEAAVASIMDRQPLPGTTTARLAPVSTPLRTHLAMLDDAAALAEQRGVVGMRVPGGRALTCASMPKLLTMGTAPESLRLWESTRSVALKRAKISGVTHHLQMISADTTGRSPVSPPYGIYPLDPRVCAHLICDYLVFEVVMAPEVLVAAAQRHDINAQITLPEASGELDGDEPVIQFFRDHRAVTLHMHGAQPLLLELLDLDTFLAGLEEIFNDPPQTREPVVTYRDEAATWR